MVGKRRPTRSDGGGHRFGGDWTEVKLHLLSSYSSAYTTALKKQPFTQMYIDAFAGTRYREEQRRVEGQRQQELLFPDLAASEPQALLEGSATRALRTAPPFHRYIFIEQNSKRCEDLVLLKDQFPDLSGRVDIRRGEANAELRALCAETNWRTHRAVLFLDPYGLQVEWDTIKAIATTRSIDLWLLFPLGIGVNRMLPKTGKVPDEWRRRLNILLGTEDWYDKFYSFEAAPTLFGEPEEAVAKASTETIGRYFNDRLGSVFAAVAPEPKVLRNSANCPLYLLCFAVGNEPAVKPALSIANHLLKKEF
jgi:three-Cys-motif partner protein